MAAAEDDEPGGRGAACSGRYVVGIVAVAAMLCMWIGSNFLVEHIKDKTTHNYDRPTRLAYFNVVGLCLNLPVYFLFCEREEADASAPPLTLGETAKVAGPFAVLYTLSNFFSVAALSPAEELSTVSMFLSTSGLFTLVFSLVLGMDRLRGPFRVVAILTGILGSVVLAVGTSSETGTGGSTGNWQYSLFALLSALFYGCYSIYIKWVVDGDEERIDMTLLFGICGVYALGGAWPFIFLADRLGIDKPVVAGSWKTHGLVAANVVFGAVVPNWLWNIGYAWTSPLVVAIGLSLCSPLTMLVEWCRPGGKAPSACQLVSAALLLVSFAFVNLAEMREDWDAAVAAKMRLCQREEREESVGEKEAAQ